MRKKLWMLVLLCLSTVCLLAGCDFNFGFGFGATDPELSLSETSYTYAGADIAITVTDLDKAQEYALAEGETTVAETNYTVSGKTLTLKNAYLAELAEGTHDYTLSSDIGDVAFTVTVLGNIEISISTKSYNFRGENVNVRVINLAYATEIALRQGDDTVDAENYTVVDYTFTLKAEYLSGLDYGTYTFTLETDIGSASFTVTVVDMQPSVEPASARVELSMAGDGVSFTFISNGSALRSITLNGEPLTADDYSTRVSTITINGTFLTALEAGTYEFVLTTAGGSCTFTLELYRDLLAFTETRYIYAGSALEIPVLCTEDKEVAVSLNGAVLASGYTLESGVLTLSDELLSGLAADIYTLTVSANEERATAHILVGYESWNEVIYVNFDDFVMGEGWTYVNMTGEAVPNGYEGAAGHFEVTSANGLAGFFASGDPNRLYYPYEYRSDTNYTISFKVKMEEFFKVNRSGPEGLWLVLKFGASAMDVGYLWYENGAFRVSRESRYVNSYCAEIEDGWYNVIIEFRPHAGDSLLEIETWTMSTFLVDDLKVMPLKAANTGVLTVPADMSFTQIGGREEDKTFNFGSATVLGVQIGDAWATANEITTDGGKLVLKGSWLATLERGKTYTYSVYTNQAVLSGSIEVPAVTLAKTAYDYDWADLEITVSGLNKANEVKFTLNGDTVSAESYTISGDLLTLKTTYLVTFKEGVYTFTLETEHGNVTFTVAVPAPQAGVPSVTPATQTVELGDLTRPVTVTVDFNNGGLSSLTLGGEPVSDANYTVRGTMLSFNVDYIKSLGAGSHEFTLTTNGGSCTFALVLTRQLLAFGATRYTAAAGEALTADLYGAAEKTLTVYLNGVKITSGYAIAGETFTLSQSYLATLPNDVYRVTVATETERAEMAFLLGIASWNDVFYVDFDNAGMPEVGFHSDMSYTYVAEGINGASGRLTTVKQFANVLNVGTESGAYPYNFVAGNDYRLSFKLKMENYDPSTTNGFEGRLWLNIRFGIGDVAFIWNESDIIRVQGEAGRYVASYCELHDGVWTIVIDFHAKTDEINQTLLFATWTASTFLFDDLKIVPLASNNAMISVPTGLDFVSNFGLEADKTFSFGATVLGVKLGDAWATENEVTMSGAQLTFNGSWLKTLANNTVMNYTVYTTAGEACGSVTIASMSLTGNFKYGNDGKDLALTLVTAGNTVDKITLDGITLTAEDYTLAGETLTLKASLLETFFGSATLKVSFVGTTEELTQVISSKKLMTVDFDNYGKPAGFCYVNMADEVVEDGINGKSGKFTTESAAAGFMALGAGFYPVEYTAGTAYRLTFKVKMLSYNTEVNSGFGGTMWLVLKFGAVAKDVAYIWNRDGVLSTQADGRCTAHSCMLTEDGYYEISITFVPQVGDATLEIETWTACSFLVDDINLVEV